MASPLSQPGPFTRRTLLSAAAGGAALLATRGLPAWARPVARPAGLRAPGSLPFPDRPEGTPGLPQIEHIVVLMLENHSFDSLLGMVAHQVPGRRHLDGFRLRHGRPTNFNLDAVGNRIVAQHATSPCQLAGEPSQSWNASHEAYDGGRNDGFVRASAPVAMRFWDQRDMPFTYSLAEHFPIGERHFCSLLGQTFPNRCYFFAGTSSGTVNDTIAPAPPAAGTIFDRLDAHQVDWAVYYQRYPTLALVPGAYTAERASRVRTFDGFLPDVAAGRLPQFTFIDPDYITSSEENPQDIQVGERFVAEVVRALMAARTWKHTVLFLTYDEHGGYYDHVPPPPAIPPDSIAPMLTPADAPGSFDRYGFRVPMIVVSPWARPQYISRSVEDHTSITAFIERKWNLPAMTLRDANAHAMTDYFDFRKPAFLEPPKLAKAPPLGPGLAKCHAAGLSPPLTG
jgi:phospholipase C